MINNFEQQTEDLNEYEKDILLPFFIKGLEKRIGEEKSITAIEMERGLKKYGHKVSGARIRKIINYIRRKGLVSCLIASSKGYYIETDTNKLEDYIDSLIQRSEAINHVADCMKNELHLLKKSKQEIQTKMFYEK